MKRIVASGFLITLTVLKLGLDYWSLLDGLITKLRTKGSAGIFMADVLVSHLTVLLLVIVALVLLAATLKEYRAHNRTKREQGDTKRPEEVISKTTANQDAAYQREVVARWRRVITECERKYKGGREPGVSFAEIFQRQPEYVRLSPLLTRDAVTALEADRISDQAGRKPPDALRAILAKEITRIETKLKLFPDLLSEPEGERPSIEQTMTNSPGSIQSGRDVNRQSSKVAADD